MYTTDFAYDGPIFLVPLSLSYPSSPVKGFEEAESLNLDPWAEIFKMLFLTGIYKILAKTFLIDNEDTFQMESLLTLEQV